MEGEGTGEDDRYARAVAEMAVPTIEGEQKLQKGLWRAAERWRRSGARDKEGGLTLVIMHGCGFTKEVRAFHQERLWRRVAPTCIRYRAGDLPSTD